MRMFVVLCGTLQRSQGKKLFSFPKYATVGNELFESLTECLNEIFLRESITYFEVDAGLGEIYVDDGKEAPKVPPKMWDLYGEKGEE